MIRENDYAPTDEESKAFVDAWRIAAASGLPYYGGLSAGEWMVVRRLRAQMFNNAVLTDYNGRPMYDMVAVRAVFAHFTDSHGYHGADKEEAYEAALSVFTFAVQTVLCGTPSDWNKVRTLAAQINTVSERRSAAVALIRRALANFHANDEDDKRSLAGLLTYYLHEVDNSFYGIDSIKTYQWLSEAKPNNTKGGSGNKGAYWVAAILAVSVGALGFPKAEGAALRPAATKAAATLRRAVGA